MAWADLGIITLTSDWQSFSVDAINTETFRLEQAYNFHPYNTAVLAAYSPLPSPGGRHSFRRIYPNTDPKIFTMEIPPDFRTAGFLTRTIQARHRNREYQGLTWTFHLYAYYAP